MSASQSHHSNIQTSPDPLFIECVEKLLPLAGERMQAISLDWWDTDRFLGLAFHIFLTEKQLAVRHLVAQLLPKFGAKAVPTLFVIYQHQNSDSTLRHLSRQALTQLDRSVLVAGLIDTLKASEDDRFDRSISQLLATAAPQAIVALTQLIETREWRTLALRTLHFMELPQTRTLLDQLICHPNPDIRQATIDILSQSKDHQLLCRLENALRACSPSLPEKPKSPIEAKKNSISTIPPTPHQSQNLEDLMRLAAVQTERQDYLGAIRSYTQIISLNPNHANAYGNRGLLKVNVGDSQGAITDFQHAARLFLKSGKNANFEITLNYLRKLAPSAPSDFKELDVVLPKH